MIRAAAADLGITLASDRLARIERHLDLVAAWRGRLRLVGAGDAEAPRVLVAEGLGVLALLPGMGAVCDLGSGAGVPGVPVAIARPELRVVLVEASRKKAGFLEIAVRELALTNVEVVHARAEALGHDPAHRESYAAVMARALASTRVLIEYALPLLRPGGVALFPKGRSAAAELAASARALRLLGGEAEVWSPPSPRLSPVVVVRKTGHTPPDYPRRPGVPARRPL